MSRKARISDAEKDEWCAVRCWAATKGYSPYKPPVGDYLRDALVILEHESPDSKDHAEAVRGLAGVVQQLLFTTPTRDGDDAGDDADDKISTPFSTILVVDMSMLLVPRDSDESDSDVIGDESLLPQFGKRMEKPVVRFLERLHLRGSTVVTRGACCEFALKLLLAPSRALSAKQVKRLVMLHPALRPTFINEQLGRDRSAEKLRAVELRAVYLNAKEQQRRDPVLRHYFSPGGTSRICESVTQQNAAVLIPVLLETAAGGGDEEPAAPPIYDAERFDKLGRRLFLAEVHIMMDPDSKMDRQEVYDVTYDLFAPEEEDEEEEGRQQEEGEDAVAAGSKKIIRKVGGLVLRGNRCVLCRSLAGKWQGMRVPSLVRDVSNNETPLGCALRSVSELCDIDGATELVPLPDVAPVSIYMPRGRPVIVTLHAFYALHPPPDGPLEDADMEDDEDLYDWYTFDRAVAALRRNADEASVEALQSMALALKRAARAKALPVKWGGVFGQEWIRRTATAPGAAGGRNADKAPAAGHHDTHDHECSGHHHGGGGGGKELIGHDQYLSRDAVERGQALLGALLAQIQDEEEDDPAPDAFKEPLELFKEAVRLDPENAEAHYECQKLESVFAESARFHAEPLDVIVVGAGASGVGVAIMLTRVFGLDPERVLLVERGKAVGETFRRWPKEMRFISPSFNHQGWTDSFDLNSVAYGTSPAFTLGAEHPTGEQYARYLCALAEESELNVRVSTEVTAVRPDKGSFEVDVRPAGPRDEATTAAPPPTTTLRSRFVIWAAGEFQYPKARGPHAEQQLFSGSELCLHNSGVRSWADLPGNDFVVIGGYESGMDAASNLASNGKRCTVVASTAYWNVVTEDPSTELAPYTQERIRKACVSPTPPRLLAPLRVFAVAAAKDGGGYVVRARWGAPTDHKGGKFRDPVMTALGAEEEARDSTEGTEVTLRTPQRPVLCAGFGGSVALGLAKELFAWGGTQEKKDADTKDEAKGGGAEDGCAGNSPLLTKHDESTTTPGLFLVGPAVRHGALSFCFVYKFRQRFGIVADAIAQGLGYGTEEAVESCRKMNMYLDDFSCCKAACGEAC